MKNENTHPEVNFYNFYLFWFLYKKVHGGGKFLGIQLCLAPAPSLTQIFGYIGRSYYIMYASEMTSMKLHCEYKKELIIAFN